jgi:cell division protein FtsI/penicillin-binding protein 2
MTRRAGALLLAAVLTVTSCSVFGRADPRDEARKQAAVFLNAWAAGNLDEAAAATDAPDRAKAVLAETAERLSTTAVKATQGSVEGCEGEDPCVQNFKVTMTLKAAGEWAYDSSLTLKRKDADDEDSWVVQWAPSIVHPSLTEETRLGRRRELPPRASILDRTGAPITEDRPVVAVGVVPGQMTDPPAVYAALQSVADVDPAGLEERVSKAKPDEFVDAVVLRQEAYLEAADRLDMPGIVFRDGKRSLAPTPEFARGLLGTVGPATAEILAEAGPTASSADLVGVSGLQRTYQKQLAGTPGFRVVVVDRTSGDEVGEPLFVQESTPGKPLQTTLDIGVQTAADRALAGSTNTTALVAVDVGTGGVLATANAPTAGDNRAFSGRYAPGSTFKIVSTAALLRAGMAPDAPVDCPATTAVEGKRFRNYEFSSYGGGDLTLAFARSCNTAFVSLIDRLDPTALPEMARDFGIGADWAVQVSAFAGSVPEPAGDVEEAASVIGQGEVLVSPLAMAEVAAAVASGQPRVPSVVPGSAEPTLAALPPEIVDPLRTMMREAVVSGTAEGLAGAGDVHAKTGTAEYGIEEPPRTHAWLVGYRGDIAFAVIVEDGGSGAENAVPVIERFLSNLAA